MTDKVLNALRWRFPSRREFLSRDRPRRRRRVIAAIKRLRRAPWFRRNRTKIAGVLATLLTAAFTEALSGNPAAIVTTVVLVLLLVFTWT